MKHELQNIGLTSLGLVVTLIFNCMRNPFLRMNGIAVGLIAGYIVALTLGMVDFSPLKDVDFFTIPMPFKYGFAFDWSAFWVAAIIYLLSVFEAVGDLTATAMVSGQPYEGEEFRQRLRGGVFADGLVSVIATALGSLPLTTFAQNNGVIQMTGVASRHVGKFIAAILVLFGLFPIVGRAFTTIPSPVLGGAMVLMFGLIAIAGVRIIMTHGINRREAVIAATAVGVGLGVAFEPDVFKMLPEVFRNAIAAGGITVVLLNLILPRDEQDKSIYLTEK
ncbi:solute carrier family 23 protein [Aggregatibacter aphrophilus]|uniref:solute carrier family 23 protein n=1 Tax=Aggregatibacter aphrophilus TaxID=732 RepID=UPI000DA2C17E|nr:solute carrier family 23 protein [Aggregatibacter aphrophilus]SQI99408.1 Xanthine permease XanQ [Aggregatibacter aphrophilus]